MNALTIASLAAWTACLIMWLILLGDIITERMRNYRQRKRHAWWKP